MNEHINVSNTLLSYVGKKNLPQLPGRPTEAAQLQYYIR